MLYLATASTAPIRSAMMAGRIGLMAQPRSNGPAAAPGVPWAADNGCFTTSAWDSSRWATWLDAQRPYLDSCLFAVVPDCVADAAKTRRLFDWCAPVAADKGYPLAYVLQDGAGDEIPWDDFDVLFVGGTTAYKESDEASHLAQDARAKGKRTHMGRVNTLRRMRLAEREGYDTVDGTFLAFGPDVNLPRLHRMMRRAHEPRLF